MQRRRCKSTRREMFKRRRVILERSIEVGHRGVSCVTGVCKEAEVGEPEPLYHFAFLPGRCLHISPHGNGMQKKEKECTQVDYYEEEKEI